MNDAILAVDGGGTRTRAVVVARDGHVIERRHAGGSNPYDKADWAETLRGLLHGIGSRPLRAATVGLAGYSALRPSSRMQEEVIRQALGPDITIMMCPDVEIACIGAFADGPGILALAGTGSVIWADDHQNPPLRIGGWGFMLGDEGSGYWIGRIALGRVVHFIDTRHPGEAAFARSILQALDLPADPDIAGEALLEWQRVQAHPRSAIASLAHVVDRLADEGCVEATRILVRAARFLSSQVRTARTRLQRPLPWSHSGSVFHSRTVVETVTRFLDEAPQPPQFSAIGGGAMRAARLAGWDIDPSWLARLRHGLSCD
ncbi:N-acetylglucosamine kinase [Novacetimonas pomaceti]|uniref:N-acetylglucosamine kinase n=1 Tax=Novacetimonas pomaceti TaxID=2021998 RepID=A0A318QCK3_9PROT|nr:BadF/BadG/BcrA/BcrD ATPase family protein [Novacetimonas pomaceti]PYD75301.1 N-acetylglucosamine kinase [Novacetimonas pomaceti]